MADRDGLRQPGRATGEQNQPVVLVRPDDLVFGGVHGVVEKLGGTEHIAVNGGGDHIGVGGTRHRHLHAPRRLDQCRYLLWAQRRIHQCGRGADPGRAEHGGDRKKISDLDDRHPITRLHAGGPQPVGDTARRGSELTVGDVAVLENERRAIRIERARRIDERRDVHVRDPTHHRGDQGAVRRSLLSH